jgi:hypothetical protein
MTIVERNDVDISALFRWGKKFILKWIQDKEIEVYIRLVGDAELNQSRVYGLRKSGELRRKLFDYNSEEHLAYLPDYQVVTKDNLVGSIILYTKEDFGSEALDKVTIKPPKELGSDATLEEQEKFQKEVDEYPEKRNKALLEYITQKVKDKEVELSKLNKKELYDQYVSSAINEICKTEFLKGFRSKCVCFGTYKDEEYKKRFFETFEEFDNLPPEIKTQLIDDYVSLEISMESLKV